MRITIDLDTNDLTHDDRRMLRAIAGDDAVAMTTTVPPGAIPNIYGIDLGAVQTDTSALSIDDAPDPDLDYATNGPRVEVVEAGGAAPPIVAAQPRAVGNLLAEIPRAEVVLKAGDKVKLRDGDEATVVEHDERVGIIYPFKIDSEDEDEYTADGCWWDDKRKHRRDIIEVNGARIVDEESAP